MLSISHRLINYIPPHMPGPPVGFKSSFYSKADTFDELREELCDTPYMPTDFTIFVNMSEDDAAPLWFSEKDFESYPRDLSKALTVTCAPAQQPGNPGRRIRTLFG